MSSGYPFLYIPADKAAMLAAKSPDAENIQNAITETQGSFTPHMNFSTHFTLTDFSLQRSGHIVQLSMTCQKVNSNSLMNTIYDIGSISPAGLYPATSISGNFTYGGGITDIGMSLLTNVGILTIRSGNNASIAQNSSFTLTLLYLVS